MDKQQLLNTDLYIVMSTNSDMPYQVDGKFIVLYTDKEKAWRFALRVGNKLRGVYFAYSEIIKVFRIKDVESFMNIIIELGYTHFIYNGEGIPYSLNEIFENRFTLPEDKKEIYSNYMKRSSLKRSVHIGSVKTQKIAELDRFLSAKKQDVNILEQRQAELKKYYESTDYDLAKVNSSNTTTIENSYNDNTPSNTKSGLVSLILGFCSMSIAVYYGGTDGIVPCVECLIASVIAGLLSFKKTSKEKAKRDIKAIGGLILSACSLIISIMMSVFN